MMRSGPRWSRTAVMRKQHVERQDRAVVVADEHHRAGRRYVVHALELETEVVAAERAEQVVDQLEELGITLREVGLARWPAWGDGSPGAAGPASVGRLPNANPARMASMPGGVSHSRSRAADQVTCAL